MKVNLPIHYIASMHLSFSGSILIAICCLISYKVRPIYIKVLGLYAVSSILFSTAQYLTPTEYYQTWSTPLGNGFVLSEILLLGLMFYVITNNRLFKTSIVISLALYVIFYVVVFFYFSAYANSYIRFVRDFLMIIYATAFFYYLINSLPEENLLQLPLFWINSAILFFFSGTLIISFMRDYIINVFQEDPTIFWSFRNFFRLGYSFVLSYAGWMDLKLSKKVNTIAKAQEKVN